MSFANDLKILYHLALAPIRGKTHQERLESFYARQAEDYDAFRARLLQGRRELYELLPTPENGVWIEMGGGTGANLEYLGPRLQTLKEVHVVDLSPSLLQIAQKRVEQHGWNHVHLHQADVTTFQLPAPADVITFSYSLTMIPDWFAALENAARLLKPGGTLGVVDFFIARKFPAEGFRRHGWWTRTVLADVVRAGQCESESGPCPLPAPAFRTVQFSGVSGQGPVSAFSPGADLPFHRRKPL